MTMTEFDQAENRLECLKLAQYAVGTTITEEVLDRADQYASFVNDPTIVDGPVPCEPPMSVKEEMVALLFEDAPGCPTEPMRDFGTVLDFLKAGHRVARTGWNGRDMWLELQTPDQSSYMTLPYIYIQTVQGDFVPWLASQTDLLAEDWYIV